MSIECKTIVLGITGSIETYWTPEIIWALKNNAYQIVEPENGEIVCGDVGIGRLAQIDTIIKKVNELCK